MKKATKKPAKPVRIMPAKSRAEMPANMRALVNRDPLLRATWELIEGLDATAERAEEEAAEQIMRSARARELADSYRRISGCTDEKRVREVVLSHLKTEGRRGKR